MKITIEINSIDEAQKVLDLLAGSGDDPPANTTRSRSHQKSDPDPADPLAKTKKMKPKKQADEDEDAPVFTRDEVSKAFKKFAKDDRPGALMILKKFKAAKVGEIDPSEYPRVMAELGFA